MNKLFLNLLSISVLRDTILLCVPFFDSRCPRTFVQIALKDNSMPVFLYFLFAMVVIFISPSCASAQDGVVTVEDMPIVIQEKALENVVIPEADELSFGSDEVEEKVIDVEGGEGMFETPESVSPDIGDEAFFDADKLVPQGEMGREGPVRVNPVTQPASKFVVVRRNFDAESVPAQLTAAERALALGRLESAAIMFDKLYMQNKRDARVLMGRSVTLQKLGRFEEAMKSYEELSALEPDNVDVKVNMLGLLGTKYPSIALRRLLDLNSQHPDHIGIVAQIAVVSAKSGDTKTALHYLGVAASMEPQNASHIYNMAIISDRAGDKKVAISYYEQALEVDTIHGAGRSIPRDQVYERLSQIR